MNTVSEVDRPLVVTDEEFLAWSGALERSQPTLLPSLAALGSAGQAGAAVARGLRAMAVRAAGDGVDVEAGLTARYGGAEGVAPVVLMMTPETARGAFLGSAMLLTPVPRGVVVDSVGANGVHSVAVVSVQRAGELVREAVAAARPVVRSAPSVLLAYVLRAGSHASFRVGRDGVQGVRVQVDDTLAVTVEETADPAPDPVAAVAALFSAVVRERAVDGVTA